MGYRSDISIALRKEDMIAMFKRSKMECPDAYDLLSRGTIFDCGDEMVWRGDWIKWYEDYYEEVKWIMSAMRSFSTYDFKRIGEDYEDYEHESAYDDDKSDWCYLDELSYMERSFHVDGVDVNMNDFTEAVGA